MTDKVEGGCLCGSVRFECDPDQLFGASVCHCRDCQYASGGGPAAIVAAPETAFKLLQGKPQSFTVKGASGGDVTRQFCSECGTPLFSLLEIAPGIKVAKVGAFDDPSFFSPEMTVWTSSAPTWAHISSDIPSFPEAPA